MSRQLRLRRLQADYEAVRRLANLHPRIDVETVEGNPPERYTLTLHVRSLREKGEDVFVAKRHRVEIVLPLTYPRDPPVTRLLTPVFHPNIAPHAVCIGDDWSAGERLDNLIQRIGEMLAFQSYNIKSPLNGRAARWVEENERRLPVDPIEFFLDLDAEAPEPEVCRAEFCSNCRSVSGPMATCLVGHVLCPNCRTTCPTCGRVLCLTCGVTACPVCSDPSCANCGSRRGIEHVCDAGHALCENCAIRCEKCGRDLCFLCGEYPDHSCPAAG